MSHARLRLRHQVQEGLHRLSLLLRDSGQPPQHREQLLNVTVCHCGQDGVCLQGAAALRAKGTGISLGALAIMLASVVLLLCECPRPGTPALGAPPPLPHGPRLLLGANLTLSARPVLALPAALLSRLRRPSWDKELLQGLQDDLRDNILNYDEQGGGEEDQVRAGVGVAWWLRMFRCDRGPAPRLHGQGAPQILVPNPQTCRSQKGGWDGNPALPWTQAQAHALCLQDAYDISQLRHPSELAALSAPLGRPLLRRDTPFSWARPPPSHVLPTSPADMADFINDVGPPRWRGPGARTHTTCKCTRVPRTRAAAGSGLPPGAPGRAES